MITGFIYEARALKKKPASNYDGGEVANELGEPVNHAGRLLLNHGYLEDAIKTQNKTFLDNKTVTKIITKMWFGEEKYSLKQVFDNNY